MAGNVVISYKDAAKKLYVSVTKFRNYIERVEFAKFRKTALVNVSLNLNGYIVTSKRHCKGVLFSKEFQTLFNKTLKGKD